MLSWIASCCHGSPKNGPIGEEAGVMSCSPAMLRDCEAGLFIHSSSVSFIAFLFQHSLLQEEKEIVLDSHNIKQEEILWKGHYLTLLPPSAEISCCFLQKMLILSLHGLFHLMMCVYSSTTEIQRSCTEVDKVHFRHLDSHIHFRIRFHL